LIVIHRISGKNPPQVHLAEYEHVRLIILSWGIGLCYVSCASVHLRPYRRKE